MAATDGDLSLFDEDEEDIELSASASLREEIHSTVVFTIDWSVGSLLDQLQRETIDLQPQYQRRDAWTQIKKSRLIESLILGLPVPQLVLAERPESKGSFIVLDGKQRLTALLQFTGGMPSSRYNAFRLRDLPVLTELNGVAFEHLSDAPQDNRHLNAFLNQPIRTIILRGWKSDELLHLVFHRLNSNVVPLSPQELRQALIRGPFLTFLNDFSANSVSLQKLLKISGPDFRMRDSELLLRLLAFSMFGDEYRGDLRKFLDLAARRVNQNWDKVSERVQSRLLDIEAQLDLWADVLGGHASVGRRFRNGVMEPRLNRALLDAQVNAAAQPDIAHILQSDPKGVRHKLVRLFDLDENFARSVETTTKSTDAVKYRGEALVAALRTLPVVE